MQASREKFKERLKNFGKGVITAWENGENVGISCSRFSNTREVPTSFEEFADVKQSSGEYMFLFSVGAAPQRHGIGSVLVTSQLDFARKHNIKTVFVDARPVSVAGSKEHEHENYEKTDGLHEHLHNIYNGDEHDKELLLKDPVINFYNKHGFKFHKVMPNFYKGDAPTKNWRVMMKQEL